MKYKKSKAFAHILDSDDRLAKYRDEFLYPKNNRKNEFIYLAGNSLGLQPKKVIKYIKKELSVWSERGVMGKEKRWIKFHEIFAEQSVNLVGALPTEVVIMNALTINIHLLLISFYQPSKTKNKIIIEKNAFLSDCYALQSQIKLHGFNSINTLIELLTRAGENILRHEDIITSINEHKNNLL